MHHRTHGSMYANDVGGYLGNKSLVDKELVGSDWEVSKKEIVEVKEDESEEEEVMMVGRSFVTTTSKSLMTKKVCDLLVSLNVLLSSYHGILSDFDGTCSYLNDMLISMSNEVEKTKTMLYEVRNKLEEKKTRIEGLELKVTNVMVDRDSLLMDDSMLVKQGNI